MMAANLTPTSFYDTLRKFGQAIDASNDPDTIDAMGDMLEHIIAAVQVVNLAHTRGSAAVQVKAAAFFDLVIEAAENAKQ